jgi:hypothetical protein
MNRDIELNVELVISQFQKLTDFDFGCDRRSVEYVDGYLNRIRLSDEFNDDLKTGLVNTIGSFLGQCIISCYGNGDVRDLLTYWTIRRKKHLCQGNHE